MTIEYYGTDRADVDESVHKCLKERPDCRVVWEGLVETGKYMVKIEENHDQTKT